MGARLLFRPFQASPEGDTASERYRRLRHPIFAALGMRPPAAQHTSAEHEALLRYATGRRSLAEIGVAEGGSAAAIREVMASDGKLALIDPFHLSRFRLVNSSRLAARRAVRTSQRGYVQWVEAFSYDAARTWEATLDFLFIDGDHTFEGVTRDWNDWHNHIEPGGVVLFHDARVFPGGWTQPTDGPVQFIDRTFRSGSPPGWLICDEVDSLVVVQRTAQGDSR